VCESTEHYCYQLVHGEGDTRSEIRQCWDLSYEVSVFVKHMIGKRISIRKE
jgi:hypothetical protein